MEDNSEQCSLSDGLRRWYFFFYSPLINYVRNYALPQRPRPGYYKPKKYENAVLFLRFGLPSTLIRLENGARKCSSKRRNLKTTALCFSVEGKHFENRPFPKRWRHDNRVISLPQFSQTQIQNDRLLRFQISPVRLSLDGKQLTRFQSENTVFKLLWRSVHRTRNFLLRRAMLCKTAQLPGATNITYS